MHTNLFWYSIFVISLSFVALYTFFIAFTVSFCASSIEYTFTFDWINVPVVSTSASAKYLLSDEILISVTRVLAKNTLNSSFPFEL